MIGDVLVDVSLKNESSGIKLRLGGIIHAARTFWALDIPYDVGYFAPTYLDTQINDYLIHHGCTKVIKLGNVIGAPNVFLIDEPKEIGDQGYEFLLREELRLQYDEEALRNISSNFYGGFLVISGNFDLGKVVNVLNYPVHLDLANNVENIKILGNLSKKLGTIFLSTSSDIFKQNYNGNFTTFLNGFSPYTDELILKENRGGSRGYNFREEKTFKAGAQPRQISHSVGVGDAFDVAYLSPQFYGEDNAKKITRASWIAAEYAVTSFPDDFKRGVTRVLMSDIDDLLKMPSVVVPWETRPSLNIYIAAPDFTFVNTAQIDQLENALNYHNFTPHRPVKENGQMEKDASKQRKKELMNRDLELMDECFLMIAVMLYDDPGTLIEIGYAKAKEIPVIVYDPYKSASNCMLTELPDMLSSDLDEVITEVFILGAKKIANGQ